MAEDMVRDIFKDESTACTAAWIEEILEQDVQDGIDFIGKERSLKRLRDFELEIMEKAGPIIEGIVEALKPEVSKNVRKMGAQVIWGVYWGLRKKGPRISIFSLLTTLETNPTTADIIYKKTKRRPKY